MKSHDIIAFSNSTWNSASFFISKLAIYNAPIFYEGLCFNMVMNWVNQAKKWGCFMPTYLWLNSCVPLVACSITATKIHQCDNDNGILWHFLSHNLCTMCHSLLAWLSTKFNGSERIMRYAWMVGSCKWLEGNPRNWKRTRPIHTQRQMSISILWIYVQLWQCW